MFSLRCVFSSVLLSAGIIFANAAEDNALMMGVSYSPVPLKSEDGATELPADDWFCDEAVPLWGKAGRGDLRTMRQLGANLVRLYGNSPANDHTNFLDEAWQENLSVAAGMTDYPFYQDEESSCLHDTDFDCFSQVKPLYLQNLQKGFLTMDGQYHPALKYMNIINEPDLKMPPTAFQSLPEAKQMCRAIISAFDAMLDAEREAGVTGKLINYTATFSYAICRGCEDFSADPALGQMWQLDDAMRNPTKYGYTPKNDITAAYEARFTHSFNTQNPATDMQRQFLDKYASKFAATPVYIGEYHRPGANQEEDLGTILALARANPLFLGMSFFQYQVAYWKGDSEMEFQPGVTEMDFGMFGLSEHVLANMTYFSEKYPVYCLEPVEDDASSMSLPAALAKVYGGPGVDATNMCVANPMGVPLDHTGFVQIASQQRTSQMEVFVERFVHHLGGQVKAGERPAMSTFASGYVGGDVDDFAKMAGEVGARPNWLTWLEFDDDARCVANRDADPGVLGAAIAWACANTPSVNCSSVPAECEANPYRLGDYVFSRHYARHGDTSNPLLGCSFQGAAMFAPPKVFNAWTGASTCAEASTTTTTSSVTVTSTSTRTTSTMTNTGTSNRRAFMGAAPRSMPRFSLVFSALAVLAASLSV